MTGKLEKTIRCTRSHFLHLLPFQAGYLSEILTSTEKTTRCWQYIYYFLIARRYVTTIRKSWNLHDTETCIALRAHFEGLFFISVTKAINWQYVACLCDQSHINVIQNSFRNKCKPRESKIDMNEHFNDHLVWQRHGVTKTIHPVKVTSIACKTKLVGFAALTVLTWEWLEMEYKLL